ncbi:hypothetical protein AVEN_45293-1 [Araneus ventricosus]|uniref:Uncharacterized protein n=1 Tax=Araneus ventricosus TaxID=182803 RepID=A0A4Y2UTM2_ARAVE|nr:hypothetical protein AVEN_45293-1 [Araneus ventricosus]
MEPVGAVVMCDVVFPVACQEITWVVRAGRLSLGRLLVGWVPVPPSSLIPAFTIITHSKAPKYIPLHAFRPHKSPHPMASATCARYSLDAKLYLNAIVAMLFSCQE